MKHIKIVGLCLAAVFAFSAVAAATASASGRPEFRKCGKTPKVEGKLPTGEFANKECTEAQAEGKYRLEAAAEGTSFAGKSKGATFTADKKSVTCKKSTSAGSTISRFSADVTITFSKCVITGTKEPCGTEGTITTGPLEANLFFANEEEKAAVVGLNDEAGPFAEFKCGTETITIEGFLLGTIKTTKKGTTSTFALSGGKQAVTTVWENGTLGPVSLESGKEEATLEMTEEDKYANKGTGVFPS